MVSTSAYLYSCAAGGLAAYFLSVIINSPKGMKDELVSNRTAAAFMYFVVISVLCSFEIFKLNTGEILAVLTVLVYARNYSFTGGGTAGILAAVILMINDISDAGSIIYMGLAGIVAGTFSEFGRPAASSAFLITSVLCVMSGGIGREQIMTYIDIAAGAVIFCFIPVEQIHNEEKRIISNYDDGSGMMRLVSFRMKKTAESLQNISDFLKNIPEQKYKSEVNIKNIFEKVCEKCSGKNYCWGTRNNITYEAMIQAFNSEKHKLPSSLNYCYHKENIEEELRNNINNRLIDLTAAEYIKMSRSILTDQLSTSSEILKDISEDIFFRYNIDKRNTERIKKCFIENDIGFSSAAAYYNRSGRMFAEIYCSKNACISGYKIYKALGMEFGKNFECTKCYDGEEIRFLVSERPQYNVETNISQKSSCKTDINGDTCDCFRDDSGNVYMVISDGMGTGNNASRYSKTASSVFRKLVLGGIDTEHAINIINSVMRASEKEEGFATLDVAKIDLDNGKLTVYKSGAAPTILKHSGSVFSVSSGSFPLGISDAPGPYCRSFPLKAGDTVAMISDGVPEESFGVIRKELSSEISDVGDISDNICRIAGQISSDDVSVIAARLIRQ